MRICFFADSESIHTVRWCAHFKSLGHEVHLISFKSQQVENIPTYFVDTSRISVKGGNWRVLLKFRQVKKIIKQINPDILHSLYATSYGITGALCGFKPYVITALGTDLLISPQSSRLYRILLKFAFSRAQFVTVMSDQMHIEALKLGVEESKLMTLPFGIDPKVFNANERNVDNSEFVITSTRNFESVYNIPHLLKSVAQAKPKIPNLKLNLIGTGSLKTEIENLVETLGLSENVTFYGRIPQTEIIKVLNQTHLFVSVSLSDGNNISLNEAMACETFCIATDIPANQQWIKHEENGFLVPINDVDGLAHYIEYTAANYKELQKNSLPLSRNLLQEKGIWEVNMQRMENEYKRLTK